MTFVTSPNYGFRFGALNLLGTSADLAADGYVFGVEGSEDGDFGNPVPIEQAVISWLQDGAVVALQGYDNREMYLRVTVDANDGVGLAQGEQALMLETGKTNTLTYSPADPAAASSVFDVVMSYLELVPGDGGAYEKSQTRVYGLRIKALPSTRSQALVSVTKAAPSGSQTITSVDTCSSTTGWTREWSKDGVAQSSTGATSTGGGTSVSASISGQPIGTGLQVSLKRTGLSASLSTTPYVRIKVSTAVLGASLDGGPGGYRTFLLNGIVAPVAVSNLGVLWFDAGALGITTLTSVEIRVAAHTLGTADSITITADDISRSNVLGDQTTTTREIARTLEVAGSARTQGSLALADATNALGDVLVYTCPTIAGLAQPNLRATIISGPSATTDSSTVSGFTSSLSAGVHIFEIPASAMIPGGHVLVARIKHASSGSRDIAWSTSSAQAVGSNLPGGQSGTTTVDLVAGVYSIVVLASMNLPPASVGSSGTVRIFLSEVSGVVLDEAWVLNTEVGRLTMVSCGTSSPAAGLSSNRLWLDAATVASPTPGVFLGHASDRSDSYAPSSVTPGDVGYLTSFGNHEFTPPAMNVFTVTTNALATAVTLSHYPRWHTHAVS